MDYDHQATKKQADGAASGLLWNSIEIVRFMLAYLLSNRLTELKRRSTERVSRRPVGPAGRVCNIPSCIIASPHQLSAQDAGSSIRSCTANDCNKYAVFSCLSGGYLPKLV